MKTLTVVSPAHNEEAVIVDFYNELKKELSGISTYKSRILIVVDGGNDNTFPILERAATSDDSLSVIKLSTNFGHQMALLAGIDHADADIIVMMDSDLQHPPAVIPRLIAEYEKGNDIVYTIRDKSSQISSARKFFGGIFYRLLNAISDVPINENAADFRLISRRVAAVVRTGIRERNLFLRGVFSWVGFKQSGVHFNADSRRAGESKYSLSRLISFAIFGIVSFSKKPLRAASIAGLLIAVCSFLFALVTIVQSFVDPSFPAGWATLVVLLSLLGGVQLMFLGIIGEYIGAIFDDVKGRPHYIIEEAINIRPEVMHR